MEQKPSVKKILFWLYGIFAGTIFMVFLLFYLLSAGALGFMPSFEELENPHSNLATEIYSADHIILGNFFQENRSRADYEEISPNVINALVATEDVRFYNHSGIDARGLGRVLVRTILLREEGAGGGSTITQQLAKLLFHEPAKNIWERSLQKLKEWIIAVKLERSYTKEEILTMYLNKAPFIYDAYGIKSAAATFFSTSADSLKVEEAAVLVGMLKNPSLFNPVRRPELTTNRRNVVLGQMFKAGHINRTDFDSLKQLPLGLDFKRSDHIGGLAPYFREYLRLTLAAQQPRRENYASWQNQKFLEDSVEWATNPLYGWVNKNLKADGTRWDIYRDGLKIYTTIDSKLQISAEAAVIQHLGKDLQPKFFNEKRGRARAPFSRHVTQEQYENIINQAIQQTDRFRVMRQQNVPMDSIRQVFNRPVAMRVFTYKGDVDTIMTPLDSIHYYKSFLRASLFSMDPQSGHVKAYVGGPSYRHFKYDMATMGKRQVGSTIKPFVYTLAMQEGLTPCDMVPNIPQTFYLPTGQTWTPRNTGTARMGEMVSLKWGLAQSNNNITAWIMKQYNPEAVARMIRTLGIKSPIDAVPALALGTPDFSLSEMVAAYATYANKGVHSEPLFVTRIEDRYGNVIATFNPRRSEAIDESSAFLMLNLLEGVVNTGTAVRLRLRYNLKGAIGGKTGTTQNNSDGWFIGVTPNLVTGIWVGGEERAIHFDNLSMGQGANMALPVWALYMQGAYATPGIGISLDDEFERPLNFNINLKCPDERTPKSEDEIEMEIYYQQASDEFF
ncbi:transglycosylase domain-containing protein [Alkaliflexus imshenetskii]|uniref:transglycosylase domain-containing protein n=1 Tax=Alkaliflexus imshenetskii TaxID=286730 RepID=UPI00047D624F|nr:transglycosylase domain-containing protein [Alkaliflexus imshenetskii]